jgi:chromosome segregation ATPase
MRLSLPNSRPLLARWLVTRTVSMALSLGGCVPATSYEQAKSAAEVEREGHRRAAEKLRLSEEEMKRVTAENEALLAIKADLESQLSKEESELAQTSMDMEGVKKEREQQAELVTQLRGELARIGDHLKVYQGDKVTLEEKLKAAEAEVKRLEQQLQYLKAQQESSEETQDQLRGALADLASLQQTPAPDAAPGDEADEVMPEDNE